MISPDDLLASGLFAEVPRSVVEVLATHATDRHYGTDEVLFDSGSAPRGWYVVLHGKVRVVRGAGDRTHVVHTEGPGGTLGEVPLFAGGSHPATAIAAEPTRCALFSRKAIGAAISENSSVAFVLLGRLALRVRDLVHRLNARSAQGVQSRLAEFIRGRQRKGAAVVSLGVTQQALAEELGTVREVASRQLRTLCRDGVLAALGGGRYRILDAQRLARWGD